MTTEERVTSLESRMGAIEKQVAILLERDTSAREAELALAKVGAI